MSLGRMNRAALTMRKRKNPSPYSARAGRGGDPPGGWAGLAWGWIAWPRTRDMTCSLWFDLDPDGVGALLGSEREEPPLGHKGPEHVNDGGEEDLQVVEEAD